MALNNDIFFYYSKAHYVNFLKKVLRENHSITDLDPQVISDMEFIYLESVKDKNRANLQKIDFWVPACYLSYKIRFLNDEHVPLLVSRVKELFSDLLINRFHMIIQKDHEFKLPDRYDVTIYERITFTQIKNNEFYNEMCETARILTAGKCGIYKLYDAKKELIYIGKSINLSDRIITSCKERKAFWFSVIICPNVADTNILEPYLIALLNPRLNTEHKTNDVPSFTIPVPKESKLFKLKHEK